MYSPPFLPGLLLFFLANATLYSRADLAEITDFDHLPMSGFSCADKVIGGYYADVESGCQMFHVCTFGQNEEIIDIKFLCLSGTIFDQKTRVCERVDEVDCSQSTNYYDLNLELYGQQNEVGMHRQGRKHPGGDHIHTDTNPQFPSHSDELEIDYDDYDFVGPTIDLDIALTTSTTTIPSSPTATLTLTPTTVPVPTTPTPIHMPFSGLLDDHTIHLVQTSVACNPSSTMQVTATTVGLMPELSSPVDDSESDPQLPSRIKEDEDVLELLEQIQADVPRIFSIRFSTPQLPLSVKTHSKGKNSEFLQDKRKRSIEQHFEKFQLSEEFAIRQLHFNCTDHMLGGIYADIESGCQFFHICGRDKLNRKPDYTFNCGMGSLFNQVALTCQEAVKVDCAEIHSSLL